jgi:hypothetical protein
VFLGNSPVGLTSETASRKEQRTVNLPVIDKSTVVDLDLLRTEFARAYNQFLITPHPRPLFPVLSQPKANAKLAKQSDRTAPFRIYSLFLAPAASSGHEMCLWRSNDCTDICLNCSGKGALSSVQEARIRKTRRLVEEPYDFMWSLLVEMWKATKCVGHNYTDPVMRLNGTSDLPWDYLAPFIFEFFGDLGWSFYDYTKSEARASKQPWDNTFSFSGHNWGSCQNLLLTRRARVAVVFDTPKGQPLPQTYRGHEVIDGDKDDLRFLDPKGVIVGLRYKEVTIGKRRMKASDWESPFIVTT